MYHKRGVYHKGGEAVKLGNTPVLLLNTMLFPTVSKLTSDFNPNSTSVNLSWLLNERLTWVMVINIFYIFYFLFCFPEVESFSPRVPLFPTFMELRTS